MVGEGNAHGRAFVAGQVPDTLSTPAVHPHNVSQVLKDILGCMRGRDYVAHACARMRVRVCVCTNCARAYVYRRVPAHECIHAHVR